METDEYLAYFGQGENSIGHHGVKGMHWGIHRSESSGGSSSPSGHAARKAAKTDVKRKTLLEQADQHEKLSAAHGDAANKYAREHEELQRKGFQSAVAKRVFGNDTAQLSDREFYRKNHISRGVALDQTSNNLRLAHNFHAKKANKHAATAAQLRAKAGALHLDESSDFLEHHGVKGQKWGEHHARRMARADANEFAKARAYYGQGAGTRRKLIKAKVETRSKNPHYKKEFDRTLSGQNLEKRSAQATRKRRRADTTHFLGKTGRGVHRSLSGGFGPVTATAATIAAGAGYAHKTGLDKVVFDKVKKAATSRSTHENVRQFLKNQGLG